MGLLVLGTVTSTMDVAREMLEQGQVTVCSNELTTGSILPSGIVALDQTSGRGQRGRNWYSRAGDSLCVTYYLPVNLADSALIYALPLIVGVAVTRCINDLTAGRNRSSAPERRDSLEPGLKWPNDLYLNGKKLGGILVELVNSSPIGSVAMIGIGVNLLNRQFPAELKTTCTSLLLEGYEPPAANRFAQLILTGIINAVAQYREHSLEPILIEWRRYDRTTGRQYQITTETGLRLGKAESITDEGALVLRLEDNSTVTVMSASAVRETDANRR